MNNRWYLLSMIITMLSVTLQAKIQDTTTRAYRPLFLIYNKLEQSIFYSLGVGDHDPALGQMIEVKPKRWSSRSKIDLNKSIHVLVSVGRQPVSGEKVDRYVFTAGDYEHIQMDILPRPSHIADAITDLVIEEKNSIVRRHYMVCMDLEGPTCCYKGGVEEFVTRSIRLDNEENIEPEPVSVLDVGVDAVSFEERKPKPRVPVTRQRNLEKMTMETLEQELSRLKRMHRSLTKTEDVKSEEVAVEIALIRNLLATVYEKLSIEA